MQWSKDCPILFAAVRIEIKRGLFIEIQSEKSGCHNSCPQNWFYPPPDKGPKWGKTVQISRKSSNPKGPKIEKIQDLEIFKRAWNFQASHPPNPNFLWGILESGLKISSEIEIFRRDWKFQAILKLFKIWALREIDIFPGAGNAILWTKRFYGHLGVSDLGDFRDTRDSRKSGQQRRIQPFSRDSRECRDLQKFLEIAPAKGPLFLLRQPLGFFSQIFGRENWIGALMCLNLLTKAIS